MCSDQFFLIRASLSGDGHAVGHGSAMVLMAAWSGSIPHHSGQRLVIYDLDAGTTTSRSMISRGGAEEWIKDNPKSKWIMVNIVNVILAWEPKPFRTWHAQPVAL